MWAYRKNKETLKLECGKVGIQFWGDWPSLKKSFPYFFFELRGLVVLGMDLREVMKLKRRGEVIYKQT